MDFLISSIAVYHGGKIRITAISHVDPTFIKDADRNQVMTCAGLDSKVVFELPLAEMTKYHEGDSVSLALL